MHAACVDARNDIMHGHGGKDLKYYPPILFIPVFSLRAHLHIATYVCMHIIYSYMCNIATHVDA